jgi:HEAT repeat protein
MGMRLCLLVIAGLGVCCGSISMGATDAAAERLITKLKAVASPDRGTTQAEEEVAEELWKVGPKAVPLLLPLLKDNNEDVRELASYTLRDIEGLTEAHLDALIESRRRGDGWIPLAIARIGTPKAIDFLIEELIRERQTGTQLTIALEMVGEKAAPKIAALYRSDIEWDTPLESAIGYFFQNLRARAAGAIAPLLDIAVDEGAPSKSRVRALSAISSIGRVAESTVPQLEVLRRHKDEQIREAATSAILGIGSKEAVPILTERLEKDTSADSIVDNLRAISGLRERGKSAGPFIAKYLESEDWDVRVAAAKTIGYIGFLESADKLIPLLSRTDDWRLVYSAAESLGRMQVEGAVPFLRPVAANHWFSVVRQTAAQAITAIELRAPLRPDLSDVFYVEFNSHESTQNRADRIDLDDFDSIRFPASVEPDDLVPVPGKSVSNSGREEPRRGLKVKNGYLLPIDEGEWGGKLEFVEPSGTAVTVYPDNTSAIHRTPQGIYAISGIAHMIDNYGVILKLSATESGKWTVTKWRTLPGGPIFSRLLKDGSLFVSCYGGTVIVSPTGEMRWFTRGDAGLPPRLER